MNKIVAGAVAGFAATVVLSAMMVVKGMMGILPELDVIAMPSAMMGGRERPPSRPTRPSRWRFPSAA